MMERIHTYCAQCFASCGVVAHVDDGRFVRVTPDREHPNPGICSKIQAAPQLVYDPQRLKYPLKRTRPKGAPDPGWQRISWDEALDTIAERLNAIKAEYGPEAVAFYRGLRRSELLSWRAWLGVLLSIAGIGLVIKGGGGHVLVGQQAIIGDLLVVGAAIAWAWYTVAAAPYLARHAALSVTVLSMGAAAVVLLLLGLPQALSVDWRSVTLLAWTGVLYTGILGVAGAYLLWNVGVKRLGGTRAAVYSNLVPVIAVVTATLTLHEKIAALHLIGGAIILTGIGLTRKRNQRGGV